MKGSGWMRTIAEKNCDELGNEQGEKLQQQGQRLKTYSSKRYSRTQVHYEADMRLAGIVNTRVVHGAGGRQ